jgi:hypothetical protein
MRRRLEVTRIAMYAIIVLSCLYGLYVLDHPTCQGDDQPIHCKD